MELADLLKRRQVDTAHIQETKWDGAKSREIGDDYKLLYTGTSNKRNDVAIAVAERFRDRIALVERISDRQMAIKRRVGNKARNLVTAYAPQAGCNDGEKKDYGKSLVTL